MRKKTLNQILCISGGVTAMANKAVKRWPICLAKSGERLACAVRGIRFPCAQDYGPMRRLKRSTALLKRSGNPFRSGSVSDGTRFCENKIREDREPCAYRSRCDCPRLQWRWLDVHEYIRDARVALLDRGFHSVRDLVARLHGDVAIHSHVKID